MIAAAPFQPPPAFEEFRILRALGAGAMGEVFLAEDELLGRQVAIKFVRHADRPGTRSRFLVEARALAKLAHPNVVAVHRLGELLGRPFLVSEWVQGQSLDRLPLPLAPETATQVALQLARALAAVHRVGVLHRDLKPANVLLAESGELKLVDFGVSTSLLDAAADQPDGEPAPPPGKAAPSLAETQPLPGAAAEGRQAKPALQLGTPLYAAPELLSGAPASRQSDLYGWGAVLYEVCSGRPPHEASSLEELKAKAEAGQLLPLAGVPAQLAELVQRCLLPSAKARPARAEALLEILEPLALAGASARPPDEPYRGLSIFGPEHAALFFGRGRELRDILERLRASSFVLVAGDSGVGKSSLCRAGVVPQLEAGALDRQRRFAVVQTSLGARPVEALAVALCGWLGVDERDLAGQLRQAPEQLAARLRALPPGEGRALFIDGLEELALASAEDEDSLGRFLGALAVRSAGFRLLATARSDLLTRLSALPSLGPEVGRALYLLRPLGDEGLRQAIEGPARALGYRFEPESVVDELVAAARLEPGSLPLMQFALAELWRKRDQANKTIPREALAEIGGLGGALARHADGVVSSLPEAQRRAAEQILRRLVTAQGTRARRTREDFAAGDETTGALAALTSARLLIARDPPSGRQGATYELAHGALIQSWDQLRAWVGRDAEKRALAQRVERAREEWERLGARGEGLYTRRQLREVDGEGLRGVPLGEREQRFLAASRARALRSLVLTALALVALPALLASAVLFARSRAQAASREEAARRLAVAEAALAGARALDGQEQGLSAAAFALFDQGKTASGERGWAQVRAIRGQLEERLSSARGAVEAALLLGATDEARRLLADLIAFRLEREHGNPLARDRRDLLAQLAPHDKGGARTRAFEQPARVTLSLENGTAQATLQPLGSPAAPPLPLPLDRPVEVPPGSYLLALSSGARLPLLLRFGETRSLRIKLAPNAPAGFVHLPAGRFLTGFDGDEDVRLGFFNAPPLHERETGAYLIARHEVTFAEWLDYLRALPPAERAKRSPRVDTLRNRLSLTEQPDGRFLLRMQPTTVAYEALEGKPLVYPGRKRNAALDWRQFPVAGTSYEDAVAYAAWLSDSGRVPGARLCREEEWERAARGADGRAFPTGDTLTGEQANIDETYGREPLAFGPDPVGSHPRSDSPVGVADLAGNVWELTVSSAGTPVIRGGSWYQGVLTARSVNREPYEPTSRDPLVGLRLCSTAP